MEPIPLDVYNNDKPIDKRLHKAFPPSITRLPPEKIDMDELREGTICLSERKRRKRDILQLTNYCTSKVDIKKILGSRPKPKYPDDMEYLVQFDGFQDAIWVSETICKSRGKRAFTAYLNQVKKEEVNESNILDEKEAFLESISDRLIKIFKKENRLHCLEQSNELSLDNIPGFVMKEVIQTMYSEMTEMAKKLLEKGPVKYPEKLKNIETDLKQFIDQTIDESSKRVERQITFEESEKLDLARKEIKLRKELVRFAKYINQ